MSSFWREQSNGRPAFPFASEAIVAGHDLPVIGIRFFRFGQGAGRGMMLLVKPGMSAWVNGQPILGGIRFLQHRDEVLAGGMRFYFSAESRPAVETFHADQGGRVPVCPVCRGQVGEGDPAVQCPGCGRWHHQLSSKKCWTYAPACRLCGHPTALDGADDWRPELEEAQV
jgi:hypothetical protein